MVSITPLAAVGDGFAFPFKVSFNNTFPAFGLPVIPLTGVGIVVSELATIGEFTGTGVTVDVLLPVVGSFSNPVVVAVFS